MGNWSRARLGELTGRTGQVGTQGNISAVRPQAPFHQDVCDYSTEEHIAQSTLFLLPGRRTRTPLEFWGLYNYLKHLVLKIGSGPERCCASGLGKVIFRGLLQKTTGPSLQGLGKTDHCCPFTSNEDFLRICTNTTTLTLY